MNKQNPQKISSPQKKFSQYFNCLFKIIKSKVW